MDSKCYCSGQTIPVNKSFNTGLKQNSWESAVLLCCLYLQKFSSWKDKTDLEGVPEAAYFLGEWLYWGPELR